MPPKQTGRGASASRSRGRGGAPPPSRGVPSSTRTGSTPSVASAPTTSRSTNIQAAEHVTTVAVRRPGIGKTGTSIKLLTNHFGLTIQSPIIYHYDVAFLPESTILPRRVTQDLVQALKAKHPDVLQNVVHDGRKNIYSSTRLPFEGDRQEYHISLTPTPPPGTTTNGRTPKVYRIRISKTDQEINSEVLTRFVNGEMSYTTDVQVAINCLNVVLSMNIVENPNFTTNGRSFYGSGEKTNIGQGLELWRGYFQSVRPAPGRMLLNLDISTGLMYQSGPLLNLCAAHLGMQASDLANVSHEEAKSLTSFLFGLRVKTTQGNGNSSGALRGIRRFSPTAASSTMFKTREGVQQSVAQYFREAYGRSLRYPHLPCVELGTGAVIPLEMCEVPPGQIKRGQPPSDLTKSMVEFATRAPAERFQSIRQAQQVLGLHSSPYHTPFGVEIGNQLVGVEGRMLSAPTLVYSNNEKVTPRPGMGTWVMDSKKFYRPGMVDGWAIMVFDVQQRFPIPVVKEVGQKLQEMCTRLGVQGFNSEPGAIEYGNPQGNIGQQLRDLGARFMKANRNKPPSLLLIILKERSHVYAAVKHFGDMQVGVVTQCLLEKKCQRGNDQYFLNVALKVNVKLGGINVTPSTQSLPLLGDPSNPVLILGADAVHPDPGSQGRPSFTAVVGSVDSLASKYVAVARPQRSGQEIIENMKDMTKRIIETYKSYRLNVEKKSPAAAWPKKIIMFRDGVSEGQFPEVIEKEIPRLRDACAELGIDPKITFIVVGKRHHIRFIPENAQAGDKKGNVKAGTIVDTDIVHPIEFDWYAVSHAGILGTSRPAHYTVLWDDNGFSADVLQQLAYALCHVYARCTRSVSIPAPTYYADVVCTRANTHYDPTGPFRYSEGTHISDTRSAEAVLEEYQRHFRPVHANTFFKMYFM
ncbi:hypothetical protein FRC02_001469 [Tulasnella sp. 418]|nr:hypothetical protein FRC02_001469 [Tulasnella sp. 418]